jgi:hypothetical protein
LKHAGVDAMIVSLRNSYWILGVRYIAKRVKGQCVLCQKQDAKACNEPVAPLPEVRVSEAPPFTVTGIDFAGPLFCVDLPRTKLYICLFTCGVVRAVHLELTDSMTTEAFLLAYRRFSARRGVPSIIYSDNAKTFEASKNQLVRSYGHLSPEWKFITPRSPWWGGWWERQVRSVKSSLKKTLGKGCPSRAELETTLIEVESCINSRPRTFVGDSLDYMNPLSPSHFLLGRRAETQTLIVEDQQAVSQRGLVSRERVRLQLLDRFWEVWRNQYLRGLPLTVHKFFKSGDLHMGVVTELFKRKDGIVRSVMLRTAKGPRMRAIQRLHVAIENENENVDHTNDMYTGNSAPEVNYDIQGTPELSVPKSTKKLQVTRSGRVVKPVQRLEL